MAVGDQIFVRNYCFFQYFVPKWLSNIISEQPMSQIPVQRFYHFIPIHIHKSTSTSLCKAYHVHWLLNSINTYKLEKELYQTILISVEEKSCNCSKHERLISDFGFSTVLLKLRVNYFNNFGNWWSWFHFKIDRELRSSFIITISLKKITSRHLLLKAYP